MDNFFFLGTVEVLNVVKITTETCPTSCKLLHGNMETLVILIHRQSRGRCDTI